MSRAPVGDVVHAEAAVAGTDVGARPRPLEMLDGGEIIQLCIKPSRWYVLLVSARYLAACLALVLVSVAFVPPTRSVTGASVVAAGLAAALGCVAAAALQWAARLFVLTNRRVLRFHGVLNVERRECLLTGVAGVELRASPGQRLLRLGSISIRPADDGPPLLWEHLSQPQQVHETLRRAIRRARNHE
jgi:membrane protein YdbS with pleckstrin-like domain